MYRFDKNAFSIQTVKEADYTKSYWMMQKPAERLSASWYLTCCIYQLDPNQNNLLDKSVFSMSKYKDGEHF